MLDAECEMKSKAGFLRGEEDFFQLFEIVSHAFGEVIFSLFLATEAEIGFEGDFCALTDFRQNALDGGESDGGIVPLLAAEFGNKGSQG